MKIPKGYDTVSKTFRLPVDLVNEMEELASKNKISLNKLVIECLKYAIENVEDEKEDDL